MGEITLLEEGPWGGIFLLPVFLRWVSKSVTALVNEKLMEGQKSYLDVVLTWNF